MTSRAGFQIWPHAVHRQYVASLTSLLVVPTFSDLQKGQEGVTVGTGMTLFIVHGQRTSVPRDPLTILVGPATDLRDIRTSARDGQHRPGWITSGHG